MKLSIFLLSCLLVGTLAKPSSESAEVRPRRASERPSNNDSSPLTLLPNLLTNLPNVLSDIPRGISEITSTIPSIVSGDTSMDSVRGNIERFLNQINPLSEILNSVPGVAAIYNFIIRIVSIPLTIVANLVNLIVSTIGRLVPGFSIPGL